MKTLRSTLAAALVAGLVAVPTLAIARRADDAATHRPVDDKGGELREHAKARKHRGKDDSAKHDRNDDKGGLRRAGASDDPPSHHAGDDKGGLRPEGVSDDPPGHDAGDDHGGDDD